MNLYGLNRRATAGRDVVCRDRVRGPKACGIDLDLNLKPHACLAVDDSPVGVQSAKAAGLFTVAFPGTSSEASGFDFGAHADMVLRSMANFPWGRFEHFSTS